MVVRFMVQLDWATRCPDGWSNAILGASVRVHLNKIDARLSKLRRSPPYGGWAAPNQLKVGIQHKGRHFPWCERELPPASPP